jgi:hypothetical protein
MTLTRDQIRNIQDIEYSEVFVPQWKDTVKVRSLTAAEQGIFKNSMLEQKHKKDTKVTFDRSNVKAVRMACVDDNGEPLFQPSDEEWLLKKNSAAVQIIFDEVARISGLSDEDLEELKNASEAIQKSDLPSD